MGLETSTDYASHLKKPHFLLPPLLAFLGLALLLLFGGENWVYSLPAFQENAQIIGVSNDPLQGTVKLPRTAQVGSHIEVSGWIESLAPSIQPRKIILYLDDKPVAETSTLFPVPVESNTDSRALQNWRLDFFVRDSPPGEHTLAVQTVLTDHAPVLVAQATLVVDR